MIWVLVILWCLGAVAAWLFVDLVESVHFPEHHWMSGPAVVALFFLWPVVVLVAVALLYVEPGFMGDDGPPPWEFDSEDI